MLVDSGNCKIVLSGNFKNLRNKFFGNSKLSFLSAGNNLFVVAGTYSRINAHCNLTALVETSVKLQLSKRVAAGHNSLINCKLHFFCANIVWNKENAVGWEASLKQHLDFADAHCIAVVTFFESKLKNVDVCVCLYRIVCGIRILCNNLCNCVHTVTKNLFVVNVEWCAVFLGQLLRIIAFKEIYCINK